MRKALQYQPDHGVPPGATIQDLIEAKGWTQRQAAEELQRGHAFLCHLINGKATLTVRWALELERVFGMPAEFWLTRENNYRLRIARKALARPRPTHCPHGHPYAGDNLIEAPDGRRRCRTCDLTRKRRLSAEVAKHKEEL